MGRRYVGFLVALAGAGLMLFGAMYGQGMHGDGILFGVGGSDTATLGAIVGMVAALVSIVGTVLIMFVRDLRLPAAVCLVAGIVGTLAAGTLFGVGAALLVAGFAIALTVDRDVEVV